MDFYAAELILVQDKRLKTNTVAILHVLRVRLKYSGNQFEISIKQFSCLRQGTYKVDLLQKGYDQILFLIENDRFGDCVENTL